VAVTLLRETVGQALTFLVELQRELVALAVPDTSPQVEALQRQRGEMAVPVAVEPVRLEAVALAVQAATAVSFYTINTNIFKEKQWQHLL